MCKLLERGAAMDVSDNGYLDGCQLFFFFLSFFNAATPSIEDVKLEICPQFRDLNSSL